MTRPPSSLLARARLLCRSICAIALLAASPCQAQAGSCAGDANGDGLVNAADLARVLSAWGSCAAKPCDEDFNADGAIDAADLAAVLSGWGSCGPVILTVSPVSGPTAGGTLITITGRNLSGATAVAVGGVAASRITVIDENTATAVTPAGVAGATSVSLTTPLGTASLAAAFAYEGPWYEVLEAVPDPSVVTNAAMRAGIIATGLPWRVRALASGIEMLLVPPGTFSMGCSQGSLAYPCYTWEQPVHAVTLTDAYYIGRYEVTQSQWQARMGSNPSFFQGVNWPDSANRPVERVSWDEFQVFLARTGLRMPTEAEWEYACRAGTTTPFHSGPGFPNGTNDDSLVVLIAWYSSCCGGDAAAKTHPVGLKASNGLGLHDMLGNVWEWVSDWHGPYSGEPQTNPTGPTTGDYKPLRGGAWTLNTPYARASWRWNGFSPGTSANYIGFRVVRNP